MPTGAMVSITVVTALAAATLVALAVLRPKRRTRHLQNRFGAEYQRAVTAHQGDARRAERALEARELWICGLKIRPLDAVSEERFAARWRSLQQQFVDAPVEVLSCAVDLMAEVLDDMGYPVQDRELALRLRHREALVHYRRAQAAGHRAGPGLESTEDMREGFLSARRLFEAVTVEPDEHRERKLAPAHLGAARGRRVS